MGPTERAVYDEKARVDRERYDRECRERDEQVEQEREAKRLERESAVEGKRERKVRTAPRRGKAEILMDFFRFKVLRPNHEYNVN